MNRSFMEWDNVGIKRDLKNTHIKRAITEG